MPPEEDPDGPGELCRWSEALGCWSGVGGPALPLLPHRSLEATALGKLCPWPQETSPCFSKGELVLGTFSP